MEAKEFIIAKEPYSEYGSNRARYYSVMNTDKHFINNAYFDYGKSPLREAKKFAKENGYSTLKVLGNKWNEPDKIYNLT